MQEDSIQEYPKSGVPLVRQSVKASKKIVTLSFHYLQPFVTAQLLYEKLATWLQSSCPCKIHWIKVWRVERCRTPHTYAELYLSELRSATQLEVLLKNRPREVSDITFQGGASNYFTRYEFVLNRELKTENLRNRIFLDSSQLVFSKAVQFGNILNKESRNHGEESFYPSLNLNKAIVECDSTGVFRVHINSCNNSSFCDRPEFIVNFRSGEQKMLEIKQKSIVGTAVCSEQICAGNSENQGSLLRGVLLEIAHPPFLYCQSPINGENQAPLSSFVRPLHSQQQVVQSCNVESVGDEIRWQWIRIDDSISKFQTINESFSVALFFDEQQQYEAFLSWLKNAKLVSPKSTKLGERTTFYPYSEERVLQSRQRVQNLLEKLPFDVLYLLGVLLGNGRLVYEALDEQLTGKPNILSQILEDLQQETGNHYSSDDDEEDEDEFYSDRLDGCIVAVCKILENFCCQPKRILQPWKQYYTIGMKDSLEILGMPLCRHRSKWKYPLGKVIVTPTRIIPQLKQVETTNRIIRDYFEFADRFIRVQFMDENEEMLWGRIEQGGDLEDRFRQILRQGIRIGDQHFQWLHFSNSGLRMHSAWFFAPCPQLSCENIWANMGDFSNLRSVPKFAARMGQCFSTTIPTIDILPSTAIRDPSLQSTTLAEAELQEDLQSDLPKHPYSDGCGLISTQTAEQIALKHPSLKRTSRSAPCAYQIRYGGCKGMLCAWPNVVSSTVLRKSMMKFESEHSVMEVCQEAQYMPAFLNRQIIILLASRGVDASVFLELQRTEWELLQKVCNNRSVALSVLSRYIDSSAKELTACVSDLLECAQMTDILKVPFVQGQLELLRSYHFNDMRSYARILVDGAVRLLGVIDETGLLQDGEVFLQIQQDEGKLMNPDARIITGKVMITRNPCLFPGDIRVATAVDHPELRHLVNVLVFNCRQTGTLVLQQSIDNPSLYSTSDNPIRVPLQHMCSGGDLDGDDYFITWNSKLFPPDEDEVALQYPDVDVVLKDGEITPEDCQDHFLKFMISSNVGQICNAHLVIADHNLQQAVERKQRQVQENTDVPGENDNSTIQKLTRQNVEEFCRSNYSVASSNINQSSLAKSELRQLLDQSLKLSRGSISQKMGEEQHTQRQLQNQKSGQQLIEQQLEEQQQQGMMSQEQYQQLWEMNENYAKFLPNHPGILGAWHPHCVKLAIEAEKAFSFGKTGAIAELPADMKPVVYPHFMEKTEKKMYKSTSVLGLMYDQLTNVQDPEKVQTGSGEIQSVEDLWYDFDLVLDDDPMFQQFLLRAHELQERYVGEVQQLIGRYGMASELEIWSGFALKMGSKVDRQKNVTTRKNMLAEFVELLRSLRSEFESMSDVVSETLDRKAQLKLVQASAWYCSVYHPQYRAQLDTTLEGFAWIPYKYLIRIKQSQPGNVILSNVYVLMKMGDGYRHFQPKKAKELFQALELQQLAFYWDGNTYSVISENQLNRLGIFMEGDQKISQIQTSQNTFFLSKDLWRNLNRKRNTILGLKKLSDLDLKRDL